jgi:ABC-type nitrate/sulfonate/bicarbonate transport system permease component
VAFTGTSLRRRVERLVGPPASPDAVPPRRRRSKLFAVLGSNLSRVWPALLGVAAIVGLWQVLVSLLKIDPTVLPSPSRVVVQGWDNRGQLWLNMIPTIKETLIGIVVAFVVSALLATVIDLSKIARRVLYPLLVASQSIPVIVIAPLFIIWFGFGLLPKILVIILVTFFPMTVALLEGFNSTEPEASRLIRSMGGGRLKEFWKLRVPTALPFFFTGLRVSVSFAVVAAIFGEWVGAVNGLGIYMSLEKNALRTDLVLAAVIITALISVILYGLTFVIQNAVMPWYRRSRQLQRAAQ